jgi:hypothetical protein
MEQSYKIADGKLVLVMRILGRDFEETLGDRLELTNLRTGLISQSQSPHPTSDIDDRIDEVDDYIATLDELLNPPTDDAEEEAQG